MATTSIGSNVGRTFATLALWAAYVNALVLVAPEVGEMDNDSQFTPSATVTVGGWTGGSSTNTVTLKCAAGQSFRDNASVQSNALRYNQSNGVGVLSSQTYADCFQFTTQWTIIDGIQWKGPTNSQQNLLNMSAANCTIQNYVIEGRGRNGNFYALNFTGPGTNQNGAVIVTNTTGSGVNTGGGPTVTDVSIVSSNASTGTGFKTAYTPTPVVTNVAVSGFTTDYSGTANASSANNATDKGAFGGTNFGGSGQVSLVGATEWQSVTNGSEDLRLNTTSAKLKNNGATTGPSVDIAGSTRTAPYDIGCWELVASNSVTGTAAQILIKPSQAVSAAATYNVTATAAQTLLLFSQAAAAGISFSSTIAQVLLPPTQAATAVEAFSGAIAQTFTKPSQLIAASISYNVTATAAQTLLPFSQALAGVQSFSASVAQTLLPFSQSILTFANVSATVAQVLIAPSQALVGVQSFSGAIAQTFLRPTQAAALYYLGAGVLAQRFFGPSQAISATVSGPALTTMAGAQRLFGPSQLLICKVPALVTSTQFFSWRTD